MKEDTREVHNIRAFVELRGKFIGDPGAIVGFLERKIKSMDFKLTGCDDDKQITQLEIDGSNSQVIGFTYEPPLEDIVCQLQSNIIRLSNALNMPDGDENE